MAKSSKTQKTSGKMAGKSATKQALIQQTENPVVEAPVAFQPTATEKKPQGTVIEVNGFKFIRADETYRKPKFYQSLVEALKV